jgi:radical SAM-linked protein
VPETRQRWRLAYGRTASATADSVGREYLEAWEAALAASGLPVARAESGRARISLAAPLPAGVSARRELIDIWLTDRLEAWRVREALERCLPPGHELVGLESVWLGAPALPGRVAGSDYLVTLTGSPDAAALNRAASRLQAADRLPRERARGGGVKSYDLRPLLGAVAVVEEAGSVAVRLRTLTDPELGSGRPDEAIAALGDELGAPLDVAAIVRERVILADDRD